MNKAPAAPVKIRYPGNFIDIKAAIKKVFKIKERKPMNYLVPEAADEDSGQRRYEHGNICFNTLMWNHRDVFGFSSGIFVV